MNNLAIGVGNMHNIIHAEARFARVREFDTAHELFTQSIAAYNAGLGDITPATLWDRLANMIAIARKDHK